MVAVPIMRSDAASTYAWSDGRCPCCYKKTEIVLTAALTRTRLGWNNMLSREQAAALAKVGTCPWCGRSTTIVAKILMQRFEPTLRSYERNFL